VNAAVVADAGTVTDAGTANKGLVLERVTAAPPAGALPLTVTVQLAVPELVKLAGRHATEVGVIDDEGAPPPVTEPPVAESVTEPPEVEAPTTLLIPMAVLVTPEAIVRFRTASGPFDIMVEFIP
jgi:hypothetical protein